MSHSSDKMHRNVVVVKFDSGSELFTVVVSRSLFFVLKIFIQSKIFHSRLGKEREGKNKNEPSVKKNAFHANTML